jgi:hypothetical protein
MGSIRQIRHWPAADASLIRGIDEIEKGIVGFEVGNFKITKTKKLKQN